MMFASHLYDIPAQQPRIKLKLNNVSVMNQKILVSFTDNFFGEASGLFDVVASVNLCDSQRGIHMSRIEQAFQNLPKNQSLPEIALLIAERIANFQQQEGANVKLSGDMIVPSKNKVTGLTSYNTINVIAEGNVSSQGSIMRFGLGATIMSACPCMQMYSLDELVKTLNLKVNDPSEILSKVPVATHSQKGRITTIFTMPSGNFSIINYSKLYEIYTKAVHLTSELLKRPDEYDMVRRTHMRPQFVEDVVRDVLAEINHMLKHEALELTIDVHAESYESIHGHDIEAKTKISLVELRQLLN